MSTIVIKPTPLQAYLKEKMQLFEDFCIKPTFEETEKLYACTSEIAIDNCFRVIVNNHISAKDYTKRQRR